VLSLGLSGEYHFFVGNIGCLAWNYWAAFVVTVLFKKAKNNLVFSDDYRCQVSLHLFE
jgi:hypothetical protein